MTKCEVCDNDSVVCDMEKNGMHYYCYDHHMMWCKGIPFEKMVTFK